MLRNVEGIDEDLSAATAPAPSDSAPDGEKATLPHYGEVAVNEYESVDHVGLFQTAKRWANLAGCQDEHTYPDFLAAHLPPAELTTLMWWTKLHLPGIIAASDDTMRQDPHYPDLLRDLQIVRAIETRRANVQNVTERVGQTLGWLGGLTITYAMVRGNWDGAAPQFTFTGLTESIAFTSWVVGESGAFGRYMSRLVDRKGRLAGYRSRRMVEKAQRRRKPGAAAEDEK